MPVAEFSKKNSRRGYNSWCRQCQRQYAKEHYLKHIEGYKRNAKLWVDGNKTKRKAVAKSWNVKNHKEQKRLAVEYKGGKCQDCKGSFPQAVYDFHHLDMDTKEHNISRMLNGRGFKFCITELDKCVLLCANCHRMRHHGSD